MSSWKRPAILTIALLVMAMPLPAQSEGTQPKAKNDLKIVSIQRSDRTSGAKMFNDYCAVCHGAEGKGDGPAVAALNKPPSDLTTLSLRNQGKFPSRHVATILKLGVETHGYGKSDMPDWGPLFRRLDKAADLRIYNLTNFIASLQQQPR